MRIIVPLQGVVQGRNSVFWGTAIPCALFYFLQLYIRQRKPPPDPNPAPSPASDLVNTHPSTPLAVAANTFVDASAKPPTSTVDAALCDDLHRRISPTPPPLSSLVLTTEESQDSAYYVGWREYGRNPYSPESNPEGVIQLGLAESMISLNLIEDWLASHPEVSSRQDQLLSLRDIALYQDSQGLPAFRSVVASFMEEVMGSKTSFNPDNIVLTSGATAAIELLSFCLADPGNSFLVPSPYYPGFNRDIKWRSRVDIIPVHSQSSHGFLVSRASLESAYEGAKRSGKSVRGVLVTSPGNPVGVTLSADAWRMFLRFTAEKNIHLICDEIYAGSVYEGEFTSVASVLASSGDEFDPSRVHIVYGFSKDLGIPGFRVGILYSYNSRVLASARRLVRFCTVSSDTQRFLLTLLSDRAFVKHFLEENRRQLGRRCRVTIESLQLAGIECAKSSGGLYCWVDMRHLLPSNDEEGEVDVWRKLVYEVKVNVTPGSACHCAEPGWFRLCFAGVDEATLALALKRIAHAFRPE